MLLGPGVEEGGGALTVHPYWVLVSIVQFLLLFYLLRRFLWGPILRTLHDRAERIREGLAALPPHGICVAESTGFGEGTWFNVMFMEAWTALKAGKWHEWQKDVFQRERVQPFKQVFRELYLVSEAERAEHDTSSRYAGQQVNPTQANAQLRAEAAEMVVLAASRVLGREVSGDQHRALIERSLDEAAAQLAEGTS